MFSELRAKLALFEAAVKYARYQDALNHRPDRYPDETEKLEQLAAVLQNRAMDFYWRLYYKTGQWTSTR